jgi:hypothetical protein
MGSNPHLNHSDVCAPPLVATFPHPTHCLASAAAASASSAAADEDDANSPAALTCARPVRAVPAEVAPHLVFYNAQLHAAAFAAPTFVNRELAGVLPSAALAAMSL